MAVQNEEGYKLTLKDLADTNYTMTKEAAIWSQADGSDMDFIILYEYVRKGGDHASNMVTINQEEFEKLATALGYVKENFDEVSHIDD